MTQTVPATCVLGPGKTGLTIGLRVLNLDGTEYAAFSTTSVAETSVAGTYRKAGGVVCPDAGGYIVWGVSGTDYAEATVESTAANVTLWKDATAPAMTGDAFARLGAPAGASVSADIAAIEGGGIDLTTVLEETMTFGEALRIMLAALAGKTDGSGTPALSFYGQDGTTVRISATVDGIGNRTAVTLDGIEA